jgi:hypothetical protein
MKHHAHEKIGWCFYMREEIGDLAAKYFAKKNEFDILKDELDYLNRQIKLIMAEEKRKLISVNGYLIRLEEKYEVNKDFISLLKSKSYSSFIDETCSLSSFKKACRLLNIPEDARYKYLNKKPTTWLYVKKVANNLPHSSRKSFYLKK